MRLGKRASTDWSVWFEGVADAAALEALRLLDLACTCESEIVAEAFALVRRVRKAFIPRTSHALASAPSRLQKQSAAKRSLGAPVAVLTFLDFSRGLAERWSVGVVVSDQ